MKHLQLHDRGATLQRDAVTAYFFSSFFLFVSFLGSDPCHILLERLKLRMMVNLKALTVGSIIYRPLWF